MLREKYDLSNVLSVVGERSVESLHYTVRFLPYGSGAGHVLGAK